ncbi:MAG: PIN domain-containing protein, partial [Nanoarchaeota archaeon]|nr:PIN domain-containing protein [Nanoarchaeota archaeon]
MWKKRKTASQKIKSRARRNLSSHFEKERKNYVIDTSVVINRFLSKLIGKGLQGKIIIPNAVMAELENLANKGREEGFRGLDEIACLHKLKHKHDIQIYFQGLRPNEMQIKFAKSGEI